MNASLYANPIWAYMPMPNASGSYYTLPNTNWYNIQVTSPGAQTALGYAQMQQSAATQNWATILGSGYPAQSAAFFQTLAFGVFGAQVPETPAERLEREKRRAVQEAQQAAAKLKAEKLLFTILSPTQVKQYTDDGYFEINVGGRIYRLHANSRSMNVVLMEQGKPKIKFCAHPWQAADLPIPDVLVSQLMMLRTDEAQFLKTANRSVLS